MKMFRLALAGALPALASLTCVQLNSRATCMPPIPDMQPWSIGNDSLNDHIWHQVSRFFNGDTYTSAKIGDDSSYNSRQLSFGDRVAYQRATEEVYWRHRIWPTQRPDLKPSFDPVRSQATIEQKVEDYLRNSELLEETGQEPITPEQLQAEMERMATHTKQPEVLRELFAALDNDPFVIAECLAKPVLLERLQLATVEWRKNEPSNAWSARPQDAMPNVMAAATASYTLPAISDQPSDCIDDSWTATSTFNAPAGRYSHTAVWTGTEMIVWGGFNGSYLNSGGRYSPATDHWAATSIINAPTARGAHTAVWTGTEMIVWGGESGSLNYLNTGGRYNPGTDSWKATTMTNAPIGRKEPQAVWTGTEMIAWGGYDGSYVKTGGKYNPGADSWAATTMNNAPGGRASHKAVWTGKEMIVWGGIVSDGVLTNTGGRYDPGMDSWTATTLTNAPTATSTHTAVWTGSEMIVWGGSNIDGDFLNTGGRYDPGADSWTDTSTTNAPTGRSRHTAVSTGNEMIVWGGVDESFARVNTGGRYNLSGDSWTATATTNAPVGRYLHTAVWTGGEMIAWGGTTDFINYPNTGGRYCGQALRAIELAFTKHKVGGINSVRLKWRGANSTEIDVYRDGVLIATTPNDGSYDDSSGDIGRAIYWYGVCEAGTQTCSDNVRVIFQQ